MENQIISIADCKLELSKGFISDTKKVEVFAKELDGLSKIVLDLSTKEKIKEAKQLRTQANKFVDKLKEFCEPFEEEGKRIATARSTISCKLNKSKSSVIESLLAPINEREAKVKAIKDKLFIPSTDSFSNTTKLKELEELDNYDWFGFADEILPVIERQKEFLLNEKIKFDEEARLKAEAEEKARVERESQIRAEAEAKAKEESQKAIDEANKKVEELQKEIVKPKSFLAPNRDYQAKIHNEILEDLKNNTALGEDLAKEIIKAIAKKEIRHLTINY